MIADNKQFKEVMDQIKHDKRFYTSAGKLNSAFLRREHFISSKLHQNIQQLTSFLDNNASISERIYCVDHQITQCGVCVCGSKLKFISNIVGYSPSCNKCVRKVSTTWKSSGHTMRINTKQEKQEFSAYVGNDNTHQASLEQVMNFIDIRSSNMAECKKWVSRADYRLNQHVLKKIITLTSYLPWSPSNYNWSIRMYNILHNTHDGKVCEVCKINKTRYMNFLRGYATCCDSKQCMQTSGCHNRMMNHMETITPVIDQQGFDVVMGDDFKGLNHGKLNLRCRKCDSMIDYNMANGNWKNIRCHGCHGVSGMSFEEKSVVQFIKQLTTDVLENHQLFTQSNKELDIYIPNKKLAVEYNGVLWHSFGTTYPNNFSEINKHKNNHIIKHKLCVDSNIKLLQINSYEWSNTHKQQIWKSMIANCLGISKRIHARKCKVVELDSKQSNDFINLNHLQGMSNAKVKLGLIHNNQLVSVMTFSKPRFTKKHQWELVRFCNLLNHVVVGGASKMLKYFVINYTPSSLISYADARYSNGNMYKSLGFEFIKHTTPSYVYTKNGKILSRFAAQKHQLNKIIDVFDVNKTELQNMMDAGYRKMWDAGTLLFEHKKLHTNC